VASLTKAQFIEHEERHMADIIGNIKIDKETITLKNTTTNKITPESIELFMQKIISKIDRITYLSDEYKHMTDDVVVLIHPKLCKYYADLQGRSYQTGTNTFGSGFKAGFRYDGIDYIPSKIFNSIQTKANHTLAAIILDREAVIDGGVDNYNQPLFQKFFNETYIGKSYAMITHQPFPNRIS
jgi:hypothetical protein